MIGNLLSNKSFLLMSSNIAHSLFLWCRNCVQDNYYSLANVLHSRPLSPWFLIYYFRGDFHCVCLLNHPFIFSPFVGQFWSIRGQGLCMRACIYFVNRMLFLANHGNAIAYFGLKLSIYDNRIKNVSWTLRSYFEFKISANACALPILTLDKEEKNSYIMGCCGLACLGLNLFFLLYWVVGWKVYCDWMYLESCGLTCLQVQNLIAYSIF